tara:strand:+ start:21 stop:242 length:222 start_codon:yes stop_codon:yes gene_type:complete
MQENIIKKSAANKDIFHLFFIISLKPLSIILVIRLISINIIEIPNADGSRKMLNLKQNDPKFSVFILFKLKGI